MKVFVLQLSFVLVVLGGIGSASADTVTLQEENLPGAAYTAGATYIRSLSSDDVNHDWVGAIPGGPREDPTVFIGRISSDADVARALFYFDLSAIPAGSTIDSISFTLWAGRATPTMPGDASSADHDFTIDLHELSGTIVEGGGAYNTAGPSWSKRDVNVNNPIQWTTPGGDYEPTVLASLVANPRAIVYGNPYVFQSEAAFVTAAQNALEGSGVLYFLAKTSTETGERGLFRMLSDDQWLTHANQHTPPFNPALSISYTPVPGLTNADFDSDGDVDGGDFLLWQRGVGTTDASLDDGDANGDQLVDGADLEAWRGQFGPAAAISSVPEPSSLFVALAIGTLVCRSRVTGQFRARRTHGHHHTEPRG